MPLPFIIAALTTVGSAAAGAWAVITSAPVLYIGAGVVALGTIGSMLEDAEREGEKKGFQHGYRQCYIDMKKKFYETVSQHIARVCGMYALGFLYGLNG